MYKKMDFLWSLWVVTVAMYLWYERTCLWCIRLKFSVITKHSEKINFMVTTLWHFSFPMAFWTYQLWMRFASWTEWPATVKMANSLSLGVCHLLDFFKADKARRWKVIILIYVRFIMWQNHGPHPKSTLNGIILKKWLETYRWNSVHGMGLSLLLSSK